MNHISDGNQSIVSPVDFKHKLYVNERECDVCAV